MQGRQLEGGRKGDMTALKNNKVREQKLYILRTLIRTIVLCSYRIIGFGI